MSKSNSSLAKIGSLPSGVLVPHLAIRLVVRFGRCRELGLERGQSVLTIADISQKIEVVVKKVCLLLVMLISSSSLHYTDKAA